MRSPEAIAAVARSVSSKIKDHARNRGEDPMQVRARFVLERFLVRLAATPYAGHVALKGGMLLMSLGASQARPTDDLDLHFEETMAESDAVAFVRTVAAIDPDEEDGLVFDISCMRVDAVREAVVPGFRLRFRAMLATQPRPTEIPVKLDLAFAPGMRVRLLDLPPAIRGFAPVPVRADTWDAMLAEKIHAMFRHGEATTRLKDFHDVALLARKVRFSGPELSSALRETFAAWGADGVPSGLAVLDPGWAAAHERDWKRFLAGKALTEDMPTLSGTSAEIAALALPLLSAVAEGGDLRADWEPGTGWSEQAPASSPGGP